MFLREFLTKKSLRTMPQFSVDFVSLHFICGIFKSQGASVAAKTGAIK